MWREPSASSCEVIGTIYMTNFLAVDLDFVLGKWTPDSFSGRMKNFPQFLGLDIHVTQKSAILYASFADSSIAKAGR
jgi:hypothetical protein